MKKRELRFDNRILWGCLAALLLFFVLDAIVLGKTPTAGVANETAQKVETGSSVTVIKASDWQSKYPDEYASYMRNEENSATEQIPELYAPYFSLKTIYGGNKFGEDYGEARGHSFTVIDVTNTTRPHGQAKCITCKTPDYTVLVNAEGNDVYSRPFDEVIVGMEPISCYTCHANTGNTLVVTHTYLSDAMGEDLANAAPQNLSCGQCHVEYYFAPADQSTTLPYTSLANMNPDDMLAFYNDPSNFPNGEIFVDYTNPDTGTKQLKAQHPEYETFMGEGSAHAGLLTCADCHMGTMTSDKGYGTGTYSDHYLVSPLEKPEILATCVRCHGNTDMAEKVHAIQAEIEGRTIEVGKKLEDLTNKLAAAVASGKYTDEQLDPIRMLNRNGQWYWDIIFVENSEGAHNSAMSRDCLDKAEALIDQALEALDTL